VEGELEEGDGWSQEAVQAALDEVAEQEKELQVGSMPYRSCCQPASSRDQRDE